MLGDVEPAVVGSAFGYWNPALIEKMWSSAKERMAPRDAARLYLSCAHAYGRKHFGDVDGLDAFCAAAEQVNDAIDPAGAGALRRRTVPSRCPTTSRPARCTSASCSARLVAAPTSSVSWRPGLRPRIAHAIKRPTEGKQFGWDDEPEPTDDERARWHEAEELTMRQLEQWFGVLDDAGRQALTAGLDGMSAAVA